MIVVVIVVVIVIVIVAVVVTVTVVVKVMVVSVIAQCRVGHLFLVFFVDVVQELSSLHNIGLQSTLGRHILRRCQQWLKFYNYLYTTIIDI